LVGNLGPAQEQGGQRDADGLAAGQPRDRVVQAEPSQAKPLQPGAGTFLDIPVIADRGEDVLIGLAGLDGVQRVAGGGDAEQLGYGAAGAEGDGLRQVPDLADDADQTRGRAQLAGDQPEQGRLARTVDADQPGPAAADGQGQAGEDAGAVGPAETEI
jgi:hypothetical protein